jgi:hypothetical protein
MTKSFAPVIAPAFGTAVLKSFEGEAKMIEKARIAQDACIQKMQDAMLVACDTTKPLFMKGNAATNPARFQVKAVFDTLAEKGFISKSTAASYQSAFWIAFEQGIPFQRDLNNKKDKPEGEVKASAKASGAVQSTSRTDLDKTLSKAMAQARLLGLTEFAAELVDLCVDCLDGFKETVLTK